VVSLIIIGLAIAVVIMPSEEEKKSPDVRKPGKPHPKEMIAEEVVEEAYAPFGKERLQAFVMGDLEMREAKAKFEIPPRNDALHFFPLTGWMGPVPRSGRLKLEMKLYDQDRNLIAEAMSQSIPFSEKPVFGPVVFPDITRESVGSVAFFTTRIHYSSAR